MKFKILFLSILLLLTNINGFLQTQTSAKPQGTLWFKGYENKTKLSEKSLPKLGDLSVILTPGSTIDNQMELRDVYLEVETKVGFGYSKHTYSISGSSCGLYPVVDISGDMYDAINQLKSGAEFKLSARAIAKSSAGHWENFYMKTVFTVV